MFRQAPRSGCQPNSTDQSSDLTWIVQINMRPARWLERATACIALVKLAFAGRGVRTIELDADFGGLFCVGVPRTRVRSAREPQRVPTRQNRVEPWLCGRIMHRRRRWFSGSWAGGARAESITYTSKRFRLRDARVNAEVVPCHRALSLLAALWSWQAGASCCVSAA